MEWLGPTRALVATADNQLAAIDLDGNGARQFTVEATGQVHFADFVPRDRGLLFVQAAVDPRMGSISERSYLSFTNGEVTRLDFWTKSTLTLSTYPVGISSHAYPVDPTGCYTVVDSDYSQTASRLVALPD